MGRFGQTGIRVKRAVQRCNFLIVAATLFVLLTTVAMILYPGSRNLYHDSGRYSFTMNFFSDLGATRTSTSHLNVASSVLFMVALAVVGLGICAFSFNSPVIVARRRRLAWPGRISIPLAIVSGIAFIGVAAFPSNMSAVIHSTCVIAAFGFLLTYVVILAAVQIGNGWENFYIGSNIVFAVMLIAYISILSTGTKVTTAGGLTLYTLSQKIIVYVSIVNMAVQALGIKRHLSSSSKRSAAASAL